ncbi:Myb/SANT-like domain-containing protein [Tanacetum coccineum]
MLASESAHKSVKEAYEGTISSSITGESSSTDASISSFLGLFVVDTICTRMKILLKELLIFAMYTGSVEVGTKFVEMGSSQSMEDNNTTKGMTEDNGNSSKTKRNRDSWKPISAVKTFLETCLHELAFDGREGSSLKTLSWKRVAKVLKDNHNFAVDQKQMKNHYDYLKTKYTAWFSLRNKTGNTYDQSTNTFQLSEEEWNIEILPHMVEDDEHIEVVNVESPTPQCSSHAPRPPVKTKKRGKQLMDGVKEEILGVLKVIANKINQPGPPLTSPPSVEDCENKLNDLGWDENDQLYEIALAIFCDPNDHYKEGWMKLKLQRCVNWVKMIGRGKGFM